MKYISHSPEETFSLAAEFSKKLIPGDIITLDGDLGAGKTAFTRGLSHGLSLTDIVVSPTFTIVNEYTKGDIPLFHFDVYRLESEDDMYDIGWEDYLSRNGICVVEWSKIMPELFSSLPHYEVTINKNLDISEDYREIFIDKIGG